MESKNKHIVNKNSTIRESLLKLDRLASDAILFVIDDNQKLIGSLTDGDLRRGFIKGLGFEDSILDFIQPNPKFILEDEYNIEKLEDFKSKNFKIIPIVNREFVIIDILNFKNKFTRLPLDAILMAGGKGMRLRPLTETTPKPLLKVGEKPIIEYNIDRLIKFGVKNIYLSINYLGEQLVEYFGDGGKKEINIGYIKEEKPLGTIGSALLVDNYKHDEIIVMNSDLLTNIDFTDFYKFFKNSNADMAVASTPYSIDVPYAVLEVDEKYKVLSLKEKPKYTYFSNAGIYILKTQLLKMIPKGTFYDITDLMQKVIEMDIKLVTYPIKGYWLDIGKHEDFKKAQNDIDFIDFK